MARATGWGRWMWRRCPTPIDRALLDLWQRGAEELGRFHPHRLRVRAQQRQHRLADGGCLLPTEHPIGDGGQLDSEEGVSVLDGMGHGAGETLVEHRSARGPVDTADEAQEDGQGGLVITVRVGLERGTGLLEERLRAGHREQRQLEQHEGLDDLRVVEGELGCHRATGGVAGNVRARHPEIGEEGRRVIGVIHDAHWPDGAGAAHPATPVVADQLVAIGQLRFCHERQEPVGEDGADEQDGLTRSDHLVLELDTIDLCDLHESSSDLSRSGQDVPPERRDRSGYGRNRHGYGAAPRDPRLRFAADRRRAMSDGAGLGLVERASDAATRGEWTEAFDLLMEADADGRLTAIELPLLAEVAYAAGHLDVTIEAWERAHAACLQTGDQIAAGGAAVRVAMHLLFDTALMAPVRGWLARAERLLDGQGESPPHAWFAVVRTYERMLTGDLPDARQWARRAIEAGSRCDPAACALGRVAEARLLILDGDVGRGLALLDEAGVAIVSGDLDPLTTGVVYCELVCALQGLAQYDVAEQWTEAMERWCETNAIGSLRGRCRVHRAEILRLRGSCHEAESQVLTACDELRPYLRRELGWPLNELGRIRLHKGDIAGAEEALVAAHRGGWDPQPGLALVHLAHGDPATAATSIRDALAHPPRIPSKERPPNSDLQRAPLLEAQVEIEIAGGDVDRARSAADELELVAARFESKALAASAAFARGSVRLAEGDAAGAESSFTEAVRVWNEVGAPYEAAQARIGLAAAHRVSGNQHGADLEQARRARSWKPSRPRRRCHLRSPRRTRSQPGLS